MDSGTQRSEEHEMIFRYIKLAFLISLLELFFDYSSVKAEARFIFDGSDQSNKGAWTLPDERGEFIRDLNKKAKYESRCPGTLDLTNGMVIHNGTSSAEIELRGRAYAKAPIMTPKMMEIGIQQSGGITETIKHNDCIGGITSFLSAKVSTFPFNQIRFRVSENVKAKLTSSLSIDVGEGNSSCSIIGGVYSPNVFLYSEYENVGTFRGIPDGREGSNKYVTTFELKRHYRYTLYISPPPHASGNGAYAEINTDVGEPPSSCSLNSLHGQRTESIFYRQLLTVNLSLSE